MNIFKRIQEMGIRRAAALGWIRISKRLGHIALSPLWYAFKLTNAGFVHQSKKPTEDPRVLKEEYVKRIIASMNGGSFLEVGVGEFPRFDRFELMRIHGVSYVGCDFQSVCESHVRELSIKGTNTEDITFRSNFTGTYAWTLFEMLENDEKYDVIYIDGHHTFYIDLPAILLAHNLLKPGGYLLLDDMTWTLDFLKANMMRSLSQWYFYRSMYDFSEYTAAQRALPHIQMIADELLLKHHGYTKEQSLSLPSWWALRKPTT
jgi:SAM-dependent methyltransferase